MATCRTCAYLRKCIEKATKEGYEHNENFDPKDGCTGIGYKANTNADRIRAMSDEDLAEDYCNTLLKVMQYFGIKNTGILEDAVRARLEWLKQPAEE